jgi:hypothetical protein
VLATNHCHIFQLSWYALRLKSSKATETSPHVLFSKEPTRHLISINILSTKYGFLNFKNCSSKKDNRYDACLFLLWPQNPTTKMSWLVASKEYNIPKMSVPAARNQDLITAAICLCLLCLSMHILYYYVRCSQTSAKIQISTLRPHVCVVSGLKYPHLSWYIFCIETSFEWRYVCCYEKGQKCPTKQICLFRL